MQYSLTHTALLALVGSAFASTVHIVNNCKSDVYYRQSSGGGAESKPMPLGSGFSQPAGQAVSIKFSKSTANGSPVVQFEFNADGKDVYYDTSNIDGNPFQAEGTHLQPSIGSDTAHPTCVTVNCPAGAAVCTEAYNQPDDLRTKVCAASTDLTFTLCSGGSGSGSGSSGGDEGNSGSSGGSVNTVDSSASSGNTDGGSTGGNSGSSNGNGNNGGNSNNNKTTNAPSPTSAAAASNSSKPAKSWGRPHRRSGHADRAI